MGEGLSELLTQFYEIMKFIKKKEKKISTF